MGYLKHLVFKPEHPDVMSRSGGATVRVKQIMGTSFPVGGGFHSHGGTPIAGGFILENPNLKWMISTRGTPILGNHHIFIIYIYIYICIYIYIHIHIYIYL